MYEVRNLSFIVAALALGSVTPQINAQDGETVLEEVVVTATKRGEQNIMDISLPVSAFSGDDIEHQGSTTLGDFINQAPGLTLTSVNPGNNVIQVRGVSSQFGDPTVGLYLDDVPFATVVNLEFPEVPTFDLASVEVLRGPQGTLYGASSQGGTVIVRTKDANPSEFEAKLNLSGSYTDDGEDSYGFQGAINFPLVKDVLGIRLMAGQQETGGFVDDSSIGKDDVNDTTLTNYRVKLMWTPTDRLTARFSAWFQDLESDGFNTADDDLDRPQGVIVAQFEPFTGESTEYADFDYDVYNITLEYDFGSIDLYSATSYIEFEEAIFDSSSISQSNPGFSTSFDNRTIENFSQEIRLVSSFDGSLNWTIGGLYNDNETTFLFAPGPGLPGVVDEVVESESWAVFGELTWSVTEDIDLTTGLRYFEDDRKDTELPTSLSAFFLGITGIPLTREASYDTWQPKLNVAWRPNDNTLLYFNAARGFRSGFIMPGGVVALNALFGFSVPPGVTEESLWSYEIGAKGSLADSSLTYDLAIYYVDWQNIQIFGAEPGVGVAFAF